MYYKRSSLLLLLLVVLLCICAECECKKWRSRIKKKSNAPKISATFRTVTPKRKIMTKYHAAPHKRHPKMNYYHPLPTKWPSHMASPFQPTYYMPSSHYPRWRSFHTAPSKSAAHKKIDLTPPFMSLPYDGYSMPLRRSDDFDVVDGSSFGSSDTSLVDMSAFNAAMTDGFFDADLPHSPASGEFLPPEISLGGWTPVDYKSFMADADFSLLNDQLGLNRRLDMEELMYSNPYEMHFI